MAALARSAVRPDVIEPSQQYELRIYCVPLPVDNIAPGQSVTFNFPVTAPRTPGSYAMQWGMQREGFGSFGLSTSLLTVNVAAPYNDAALVKVTVPAQMQTGSGHDVSVTMRNTGTTTWAPGTNYKLGSLNPQDNLIWGVNRIPLTTSVAPGQDYTFTFRVTALCPTTTTCNGGWCRKR